jgi:hypothetical protein
MFSIIRSAKLKLDPMLASAVVAHRSNVPRFLDI